MHTQPRFASVAHTHAEGPVQAIPRPAGVGRAARRRRRSGVRPSRRRQVLLLALLGVLAHVGVGFDLVPGSVPLLAQAPAPYQVVAVIPVGGTPLGIAVTPDGTEAWIAGGNAAHHAAVIDLATRTKLTVFPNPPVGGIGLGGTGATDIAISQDGLFAYVTTFGSHRVTKLDVPGHVHLLTSADIRESRSIAVSPDGSAVYKPDFSPGTRVRVVETQNLTQNGGVNLTPGVPRDVALTPDGGRLLVTVGNPAGVVELAVMDVRPSGPVVTTSVPLPGTINFFTPVATDGTRAYVGTAGPDQVVVLDVSGPQPQVVSTLPMAALVRNVVLTPDGRQLLVPLHDHTVVAIDTATGGVLATIGVD